MGSVEQRGRNAQTRAVVCCCDGAFAEGVHEEDGRGLDTYGERAVYYRIYRSSSSGHKVAWYRKRERERERERGLRSPVAPNLLPPLPLPLPVPPPARTPSQMPSLLLSYLLALPAATLSLRPSPFPSLLAPLRSPLRSPPPSMVERRPSWQDEQAAPVAGFLCQRAAQTILFYANEVRHTTRHARPCPPRLCFSP